MSMEADLVTLLKTICIRTFPDVAESGTEKPYITWQALGGQSLRYIDNTAVNKRNTLMQINVWATTRLESTDLARQIEDALCASNALTASPDGEPLSTYEDDTRLYGSIQRFSIYSSR